MPNDNFDPKYFVNYSFRCFRCNEEFNVHFAFMNGKEKITCPSCDQELNQEAFSSLKRAVDSLKDALQVLDKHNSHTSGFGISLNWDQINKLPNKPSDFFTDKESLPEFVAFPPPGSKDFFSF